MSRIIRISIHRACFIACLLMATIGCDQTSKLLVRDTIPIAGSIDYAGGTLQIRHMQNTGAFLSWGAGLSETVRFAIFTVAVSIVLLIAAYILFRQNKMSNSATLGLALIVGGGIGNLIDRIAFGSVTDFLFVDLGAITTGIFNIADMAIVGGVLILACGTRKGIATPV